MFNKIGIVVIGRNEGQHIRQSLLSVINKSNDLVYVDSDSSDNSVEQAQSLEVKIISLDPTIPLSAARARNTGANYLLEANPNLEFIQFVDGDSLIADNWLENAVKELNAKTDIGVVCGALTENSNQSSIYNRLCSLEWNQPEGETLACGGNMMVRAAIFQQLEGFNETLIAGEDPELCLRVRQQGQKIFKLNEQMGWHNAEMTSFGQWWKRTIRGGYAYAQSAWLHGHLPERYCVKESISIWFWGLCLPLLALITIWLTKGLSLILLLTVYIVLFCRVYISMKGRGFTSEDGLIYALFCVIGKFPELIGQIKFYWGRVLWG